MKFIKKSTLCIIVLFFRIGGEICNVTFCIIVLDEEFGMALLSKLQWYKISHSIIISTVFIPLAAQGTYQSHFRWALIKTLISGFFSLKLVIFDKKINIK